MSLLAGVIHPQTTPAALTNTTGVLHACMQMMHTSTLAKKAMMISRMMMSFLVCVVLRVVRPGMTLHVLLCEAIEQTITLTLEPFVLSSMQLVMLHVE